MVNGIGILYFVSYLLLPLAVFGLDVAGLFLTLIVNFKTDRMKRLLFISVLATVILMGCSKDKDNNNNTPDPNRITMSGSVFSPSSLQVNLGATVTWNNNDNMVHTVTADDASFDSGDISAGASFTHTFSTLGTYTYHCIHHSGMTGTVTVVPVR